MIYIYTYNYFIIYIYYIILSNIIYIYIYIHTPVTGGWKHQNYPNIGSLMVAVLVGLMTNQRTKWALTNLRTKPVKSLESEEQRVSVHIRGRAIPPWYTREGSSVGFHHSNDGQFSSDLMGLDGFRWSAISNTQYSYLSVMFNTLYIYLDTGCSSNYQKQCHLNDIHYPFAPLHGVGMIPICTQVYSSSMFSYVSHPRCFSF